VTHGIVEAAFGYMVTIITCACGGEVNHVGIDRHRALEKFRQHVFLARATAGNDGRWARSQAADAARRQRS
jgi:hypothetical protein